MRLVPGTAHEHGGGAGSALVTQRPSDGQRGPADEQMRETHFVVFANRCRHSGVGEVTCSYVFDKTGRVRDRHCFTPRCILVRSGINTERQSLERAWRGPGRPALRAASQGQRAARRLIPSRPPTRVASPTCVVLLFAPRLGAFQGASVPQTA